MTAPVDTPAPSRLAEAGADAVDAVDAGRSVVAALGGDTVPRPPRSATPDSTTAGRSVVEALQGDAPRDTRPRITPADRPAEAAPRDRGDLSADTSSRRAAARAAEAERLAAPAAQHGGTPGVPQIKHGNWTEPEEHRDSLHASTDADFPIRSGMRRAMSLILVAALAATAVTGWVAYQEQTALAGGVAALLGFVTLVVWAVRASCTVTKLTITRGQLRITRAGHTEVVDLASPYTPIAIVGEPGQRQWTVLAERPGLPLVVITSSMVDPYWFTTALYRLRPELRPGHAVEQEYAAT
ncbi:hypothetical protein ACFQ0K_13680 [Nocardioides caeni]|uniref:PH domain-containing protein n=1 Tax=Nocardioides caeni TaxID=574700 RepID=A0A4S8MZK7_9ACTN|nr:hypothetical protein [Nocardioides caeni]THV08920.1 hypothetical protein E9934_18465 [Nocardioides caeni]